MPEYIHLHNHTQFSLLDGASDIGAMMRKAAADGQKGVALTDHGNMFGAFKFVAEANKHGVKPIVGCEFYVVENRHKQAFKKSNGEKDKRYHQLLLAKNQKGYENLSKLCSLGFIEGMYSKFPRIDKELLEQYSEGLIATSCCIGAEIPQAIIQGKDDLAKELIEWYVERFGDDFYIELQRHKGLENIDGLGISQEDINQKLLEYAKKYKLKIIATNDSHYIDEEDNIPHDMLLCINTGSVVNDEKRFKFPSSDFYFKSQEEMNVLFSDVPEAIDTTMDVYDKIEKLELARDILLPNFPLPDGFKTQQEYLVHIAYEGAQKRYKSISQEIKERLDFELSVIDASGYPGYFLIVQDFTSVARQMGVSVGPGRGSAAGSVVAYCLGITNVDPIKYDLLFERFLNPERVSMPDIDIDFDDVGRQKVIDYVIDKYGRNQVAQITTYGTMAARSSIRDVGRVMDIPLHEVDVVAKTFPENLKATLKKVLKKPEMDAKLRSDMNPEDVEKAEAFRKLAEGEGHIAKMLGAAVKLEGSVRNTGIHACGVVITPDDITNYVPVKADKDTGMLVTQFDNSVAEDAGLLKMDFLGLKTLSIIRDAVLIIKETEGVEIIPDDIDLEDEETYKLFQRGDTIGVFQYESPGMQKYLKELEPDNFEDIIAMNALYRPGPIAYIPEFIERRHGRTPISYDLDVQEEQLKSTYGITVYQEQVMLLSQKIADFTKGQADALRKAMGKKKIAILNEMYVIYLEGGTKNGHPKDKLDKIWKDWEAFASYAFNKSHSTCYAYIAFQTAYLKAHYPAAFMASVLTHNKNDISKVNFFLRESKRLGLTVLGPDINESALNFTVNKEGAIRFGLSALKGVGEGPVGAILEERTANGPFQSVFDMMKRLNLRSINKKVMESLAYGGGLDRFDLDRSVYFTPSGKYATFLEHLLKYGNTYQHQKADAINSLFGMSEDILIDEPTLPEHEKWPLIHKLTKEKEVAGIYISGHPLDDYQVEIDNYVTCPLEKLEQFKDRPIKVAGIVTNANHRISKKGTGWGIFTIQDYNDSAEFVLFTESYQKFKSLLEVGEVLYIDGSYQKSWRGEHYELKIKDIRQLESIGQELTESITINIGVHQLTEEFIAKFNTVIDNHLGEHRLKVLLLERKDKLKLPLISRSVKVNADVDFIKAIEELGLRYKINV